MSWSTSIDPVPVALAHAGKSPARQLSAAKTTAALTPWIGMCATTRFSAITPDSIASFLP